MVGHCVYLNMVIKLISVKVILDIDPCTNRCIYLQITHYDPDLVGTLGQEHLGVPDCIARVLIRLIILDDLPFAALASAENVIIKAAFGHWNRFSVTVKNDITVIIGHIAYSITVNKLSYLYSGEVIFISSQHMLCITEIMCYIISVCICL